MQSIHHANHNYNVNTILQNNSDTYDIILIFIGGIYETGTRTFGKEI